MRYRSPMLTRLARQLISLSSHQWCFNTLGMLRFSTYFIFCHAHLVVPHGLLSEGWTCSHLLILILGILFLPLWPRAALIRGASYHSWCRTFAQIETPCACATLSFPRGDSSNVMILGLKQHCASNVRRVGNKQLFSLFWRIWFRGLIGRCYVEWINLNPSSHNLYSDISSQHSISTLNALTQWLRMNQLVDALH